MTPENIGADAAETAATTEGTPVLLVEGLKKTYPSQTPGGQPVEAEDDEDDAIKPLPERLVIELTAYRTLALRNAVAENPHIAMTALLHKLISDNFMTRMYTGAMEAGVKHVFFPAQDDALKDSPSARAVQDRHAAWAGDIPKDDDALWAALEDADLADRIRAAPAGLNAPLGENGARLSGGERRRLGLARAYLRPAPWLVLDEPTEGLDAATEARVLERLARRLERTGQGLILVSHRPAPLALCDHWLMVTGLSSSGAVQMAVSKAQAAT